MSSSSLLLLLRLLCHPSRWPTTLGQPVVVVRFGAQTKLSSSTSRAGCTKVAVGLAVAARPVLVREASFEFSIHESSRRRITVRATERAARTVSVCSVRVCVCVSLWPGGGCAQAAPIRNDATARGTMCATGRAHSLGRARPRPQSVSASAHAPERTLTFLVYFCRPLCVCVCRQFARWARALASSLASSPAGHFAKFMRKTNTKRNFHRQTSPTMAIESCVTEILPSLGGSSSCQ